MSTKQFESGFTWISLLAILFLIFVFTPALIWLDLVAIGVTAGSAVEFCTLLLFAEYLRLLGKKIRKQEAAIIFGMGVLAGSTDFLLLIYRAYFVQSPILGVFGIDPSTIPSWWTPSPSSGVYHLRTFFHTAWLIPLIVFAISRFLYITIGIFFGLLGRELYIEGEKLPFPIQRINVTMVETLVERQEDRINVFTVAAILSLIYGFLLYTIPLLSKAAGYPIVLIPIPWVDLWYYVQPVLPGASFGVATDIMLIGMGLVLPTWIVVSIFIGSILRFLVINPMLVALGQTMWAFRWTPGMDVTRILQESTLYFWVNPLIGIGFGVGLTPILLHAKDYLRYLKPAFKTSTGVERISGTRYPNSVFLILFVVGCIGVVIMDLILIPDFPVWALILYEIVFPFLGALVLTRMIGITGQSMGFPNLRELTIVASGYPKVDAWFLPMEYRPGSGWVTSFKICQLTETTIGSWLKAYLIGYPLSILAGFIFVSAFWQIAQIPSAEYPGPAVSWPVNVIFQALWITRKQFFDLPTIIVSGLGVGVVTLLSELAKSPISMISIAVGLTLAIPSATTMFIAIIVKVLVGKVMGKQWVDAYKNAIAAGLITGEGVAVVLGVAVALAARSIWSVPF